MSKLNKFKFFQENESEYKNVGTHLLDSMLEALSQQRIEFRESQQRRLRGGEEMYYDAHLIVNLQGLNHITQSININNNERV